MSKKLRCLLLCLTFCIMLPVFRLSAAQVKLTAPQNSVNAYLSLKAENKTSHTLRAVIAEHYGNELKGAVLTLSFTGKNAFEKSYSYSDWKRYSSLNAGSSCYVPESGTRLYAIELSKIANGSWDKCTLRLTQNGKTLHEASLSYSNLLQKSGLVLMPTWDGSVTDWMGQIPDNISLADLTIPGTHDSGATFSLLGGIGQCQSLSITEQLACGVRFLDIRIKIDDGKLQLYHGVLNQQTSFEEVRTACTDFLKAHPGEVILMSIKQEDDNNAGFPAAVKAAIDADSGYWYTGTSLPTLGQARGKIVLFARYNSSGLGINCNNGWADNTDFTMNNGVPMKIQDYYKVEKDANIDKKWDKIKSLADFAHSSDKKNTFCLNFSSGYTGWTGITAVSDVINPKLANYFANAEQGCYGTYATDFVTSELAAALIAVNFPKA